MFLAIALNVTPIALLLPDDDVMVDDIAMSPAMFSMWWRSVGPVPASPTAGVEAMRDKYEAWQAGLPPGERAVFDRVPELLVAQQRVNMATALLAAGDDGFAELRLLEAMRAIDEAFTTLTADRDYLLAIPHLGDEASPTLRQEYDQLRAEEFELLRRWGSNRSRATAIEAQLIANRGGQA